MSEIDKRSRRTHGGKGPGRHHIYLARSFDGSLMINDIDNFFGGDDNDVAGLDFLINLLNGFADFM
jgi:hypothetical protein